MRKRSSPEVRALAFNHDIISVILSYTILFWRSEKKKKNPTMISNKINYCQSLTKRLKWNKSFILKANLICLWSELKQLKDVSRVPASSFAWAQGHILPPLYILDQQRQTGAATAFCSKKKNIIKHSQILDMKKVHTDRRLSLFLSTVNFGTASGYREESLTKKISTYYLSESQMP